MGNNIGHWYEEDEEVFVHPRDPYHRVDVLKNSRHVKIRVDGEVVAETDRPRILFETGLPPRYYFPLRKPLRMYCTLVHIQNRCRVRRYSKNHETSDLRPFTFGHRKRALEKRPALQRRIRHAPSPDHPRQQQGRTRLDNIPLVGMRLP
jgi:hypothetical protein